MVKSILLNKERLAWLLLSAMAMFVSAYSVFGWMDTVGRISGWTGLPQYELQIPRLRVQAEVWLGLAVATPFLAAWFLGLGRREQFNQHEISGTLPVTYPGNSHRWLSSVFEYGVRLGLSIVGALGFALCLFLLEILLYNLGLHAS